MNGLRKAAVTVAVASGVVLALGGGAAGHNLTAHWEFDGYTGTPRLTASDSVGTNDGTLENMPGDSTNWVEGKVGAGALSFDGSNDKVDVPYAAELNPNQFSFALWVKPNGGTYYRSPLMCRNDPPQSGYNLYETPDNDWSFWIGDGTDVGSNSPVALLPNPTSLLRIGAGGTPGSGGDLFFPGLIDDVRLYDAAIDAAAVQALYDMGKPLVVRAVASDPDEGDAVLGAGDDIYVWFDMDTNLSMDDETKTGADMNDLFPLSGGHIWGTAAASYDLDWVAPNVLKITVTDAAGATIDVGDVIAVDASAGIQNTALTQTATGTVTLGGDWGTGSGVPAADGAILLELWLPQVASNDHSVRTSSNPPLPSLADYSTTCEGYQNYADSYNTRLRGYLHPPEDGDYVFYLSSDDPAEVWLGYDDNPANARKILERDISCGFTDWTAESPPITLETGVRYYIEAVHREGGGSDHVRVGWTGPSALDEKPIDGSHLSPAYLEPALRAIVADDDIDDDAVYNANDTVTITFHQSTNQGLAAGGYTGGEMDAYFQLGGGHTWGPAGAYTVSWLDDWTLQITVNDTTGATIDVGDTITVRTAAGITDKPGLMPPWSVTATLAGNWGLAGVTGLVAHWRLDETNGSSAQDSAGTNHGTIQGDPALGWPGKVARAFKLDGSDDYVNCGNDASLNFTDAITISAWVSLNSKQTGERAVVRKDDQWTLGIYPDGNEVRNLLATDGTTGWTGDNDEAFTFAVGVWYHLAFTWDGSALKHYANGAQLGTDKTVTGVITTGSNDVALGAETGGGSLHLDAAIDDVRIYSVALTVGEIDALYQAGAAAVIMRASAIDPDYGDTVLGPDDRVTLTFDTDMNEAMNNDTKTGAVMDTLFVLSGGHTWGDGSASYLLEWPDLRTLRITVQNASGATIDIGDTMATTATADVRIQGSMARMRPVKSERERMFCGKTSPRRGCSQRRSASTATTREVASSTIGW